MAKGKKGRGLGNYFSNKPKNTELLSSKQTSNIEELKQEKKDTFQKPGQLMADFISTRGEKQIPEKPGTSFERPVSKKKDENKTWVEHKEKNIEHE